MKKYALCCIAILLCIICTGTAYSVPADPEPFLHKQSSGEVITCYLQGDEFLHWTNDQYGRLIVMRNGDFYLANWRSKEEVKRGDFSLQPIEIDGSWVKASNLDTEGNRISLPQEVINQRMKNLIPDYVREAVQEKIHRYKSDNQPWKSTKTSDNRLKITTASSLERNILIIHTVYDTPINITPMKDAEIYDLVFNESRAGSVAHYYSAVTGGKAKFTPVEETYDKTNDGVVVVKMSGPHPNWAGNEPWNAFRPIIQASNQYVDFSKYDKNDDGRITTDELSICIIVHGYETSSMGIEKSDVYPSIWGHSWSISSTLLDGVYVSRYFAQGAFHGTSSPYHLTMGIIAHELGHSAYDFDDVYDYGTAVNDGEASALGYWSLMASGSWGYKTGEKQGTTPAAIDPYNLTRYGIADYKEILSNNANGSYSMSGTGDIYRVNTNNPKQYFLLQYRNGTICEGYDLGILEGMGGNASSGGVLIYHVDESVTDSNINDRNNHPMIDIEEAHGGIQHLQQVKSGTSSNWNKGDLNDLFANNKSSSSKTEFSSSSNPNSNQYNTFPDPAQTVASNVKIHSIYSNSTTAGFSLGTGLSKKVTSITLSAANNDKTILAGQQKEIIATIMPTDADDPSVTWSSSNTNVAAVDANGLVTAKMISTQTANVTITATANDGSNVKGSIALQVTRPAVKGVYFSPSSVEVARGATYDLYKILNVDPADAIKPAASSLTWKSSDPSAVSVTNEGVVKVLKDNIAPNSVYVEVGVSVSSGVTRTDQCYIYTPASTAGVTFNLTTKLEGRKSGGGSGSNIESITVALYGPVSTKNAKLYEGTAVSNENGVASFKLPAGTVKADDLVWMWVKGARYLAKIDLDIVSLSSNVWNYEMSAVLKAGDANDDNKIETGDFAVFSRAYPSVEGDADYNASADFDGDGAIRANDFTLFYLNNPGAGDNRLQTETTSMYRDANKNGTLGELLQNEKSSGGSSSSGGCSAGVYGAVLLVLCLLPFKRGKK